MNRVFPMLRAGAAACAAIAAFALSATAQAAPATSEALALMPKEAQVAIALPPIAESLQAYVEFAKKVAPNANIDAELAKVVADLAKDAKVEGAENLPDIFLARGLDPSQAIAVFLDFSKSVAEMGAAEKGGADETKEEASDVEADGTHVGNGKSGEKGNDIAEMFGGREPGEPAFALVAGVQDAAKVEELVTELAKEVPGLDPAKREEVEQGSLKVSVNGDYAHFTTDKKLVMGNKDLVLATAAQWEQERKIRYGTSEVPAGENEIVALVYGDRLFPVVDKLIPSLKMDATTKALVSAQVAAYKDAMKSEGEEDPIYITHSVSAGRSDLAIKIDDTTHPGYRKVKGSAQPLRLAPLLPENTLAMLSLRFNEEAKKALAEQILPAIQQSGEQAAVFAVPAIQMIGDEITIGIAAAENDFPSAFIMIALAEPDAAKGMLNMLVPSMPAEKYKDEEIKAIAAPIPVPVSMATPGDMVVVSNNIEGLKKIIDLKKDNAKTNMLQSLKDPMNPDTPRYQALVFKSQLLTDVVLPLSALGGGLPPDIAPAVNQGSAAVDEIRFVSEQRDNWTVSQLTVYLK